jgi:hypothetical protein
MKASKEAKADKTIQELLKRLETKTTEIMEEWAKTIMELNKAENLKATVRIRSKLKKKETSRKKKRAKITGSF